MKLLFFDDYKFGVVKGDNVVDCSDIVNDIPHLEPQHILNGVIEKFDTYRPRLEAKVASSAGVPLSSVRIRAPSPKPRRVVCMAVNYNDGMATPRGADSFHKAPDAVIGDGDTMVLGDIPATVFEGEAELALIIGKKARNISKADAMSYIFGYTQFIDGSARGLPIAGFYSMKSRNSYAPLGPFIVTKDEVPDPYNLHVRLWNNEELMQDYSTADMFVKIDECIEFVTKAHEMEPGDVLALGTNHRGLHPFQDGHLVEMETEPLGRLHIKVQDDLKRTWQRQTRFARKEAGLEGLPPQLTGKYAPGA
ncbi:MAG TPA: fumarylacetoacetate hydrolase family protein [Dehalococcoidia bacterium]|nr:fumarylacetoacetate hydrolase family protein [Dehalococcoidia bacterium]